jgi:hypothetical protein
MLGKAKACRLWLALALLGLPLPAAAQEAASNGGVAMSVADADSPAVPPQRPPVVHHVPERGDMELGLGFSYLRFRSSFFNANTFGTNTSFTYFLEPSMAVEGDISTGWGSQSSSSVGGGNSLLYGGGFRVILPRDVRVRPWAHAVLGGIHMLPQSASGNNAVMVELGGGADWRLKPWLWLRVEGNYIRSQLYSSGQNNLQVASSIVYRF